MRLSVVDLSVVAPGSTESDALRDSLDLARHAEALGLHRIWFAEHHIGQMGASHHPELLITAAAAATSQIRVGSGAVLMNHTSPLIVGERFRQLEAMYPGRIDLGMGRAGTGPVIDLALQQDRRQPAQIDHDQQVAETLAWVTGGFPAEHPFAQLALLPSVASRPETWLLGSSRGSAQLAAALGIGYAFASFIHPRDAAQALRDYRAAFRPGASGLAEPRAILAANITVGDDAAAAARLVASPKAYYARLARGNVSTGVPDADTALAELSDAQAAEATLPVDGAWPRFLAGSPDEVRDALGEMVAASGADEVMAQSMVAMPADRLRSLSLLAGALGVTPRWAAALPDPAPRRSR
ncbi:MsnO8 family LLM class oxidoreductase [Leucobacter sp. M11]|uniref:MsnO8 family LLM class oxidoreductase n=1 Tax=Leucobacter sp. M11 TaxID=2993565 RepID=UPI002D804B9B|nr:MsnO8 family LLM class oxidoreductase [Leucobacter sp. M11]MEB4613450.1 MsnO8 family LLM class oxidoreductase [Leucobacter sp. M11]